MRAKYEMKNVGNVTARDISLPKQIATPHQLTPESKFVIPPVISLGPGDSHEMAVEFRVRQKSEQTAMEVENEVNAGKSFMEFGFGVTYKNGNDAGRAYQTIRYDKLSAPASIILDSQLRDFDAVVTNAQKN